MSLSGRALEALNEHWAVAAIGTDELERAGDLVCQRLARRAVGRQISFSFEQNVDDEPFLERVALAFELAAIEGLDELSRPAGLNRELRDQAVAASFRAFDIRRLLPVRGNARSSVLRTAALRRRLLWRSMGGSQALVSRAGEALKAPSVADAEWDRRLLYRLFECWVRLFRKEGWDDLDRIREIVAGLRNDQAIHEERRLRNGSQAVDRAIALRLAALYNWAKATETLAGYMLQGEPGDPFGTLDKHFEAGIGAAAASGDAQHEMVLRWLHATARIMVTNSLWWATRTVNSKTSDFVRSLTHREHQAMFELLPPQRAALLEQGLLDQAKTAIVVDMPTSGGKTLLAQFRILQALNQFRADQGWVVYVAPTRALSAQITRRLRTDFEPIGLRVEQLTAAVEVDAFGGRAAGRYGDQPFDILVATPEKLSLVIRNRRVEAPSRIGGDGRSAQPGIGRPRACESSCLLATVKRDCPQANFLLLMPYVEGSESLARWLAQDIDAGNAISLGTVPWKPNERIVGLYRAVADDSARGGWRHRLRDADRNRKGYAAARNAPRGGREADRRAEEPSADEGRAQKGLGLQTAAIGAVMSARGTSIAVGK